LKNLKSIAQNGVAYFPDSALIFRLWGVRQGAV